MPDPDSSPPWYDNRSLFSDHYLEERLPHGDAWEEDVSEAWIRAREIWENTGDRLEGLNEAQTEDEFIRPVLEGVLGFERTVQTGVRHRERLSRPDYLLFADEEAKRRSEEAEDDAGRYEPAVAVADAKYWGRPLDRHLDDARDELSHANPSFQIVDYLVATGVEWGVLTNGARWRLYYTGARSRIDTFYEADLERILREGDDDAFRWFQLFFRAGAFVPAPQAERSFLASVHEGSVEYGARLESQLKELIFEDVFLHLARGFLEDWQGNGNGEPDQERLDEIYQGTLRLLYRLLFLLHAEARGLLPVGQRRGYRSYSLRSIVRDAAEMLDEGATLSAVSTNLWNDLDSLFRIIDRGESDLDVPHYDGGLFRQGHPDNAFLENHAVADRHLVPALDLLAREQEPDDRGRKPFVDYKTLNVQQLGSIYEGLLEFKLRRAEEELAVVKADGTEVYEPASEVEEPRRRVAEGDLYLMNDKGERKATGSYYTPHYIVEYIVEHTLGPVLEKREERFRDVMERLEEKPGDALLERKAVDALLGIKVCDPAMGSGHFLVHAVDWLAEHIIAVLNEFPGNPLLQKIEEAREEILRELDEQDVEVNAERLTDTGLLKRMVMKRCIYGVDLNPMAVELAKLSLWLDSFTVGAPLSFLDHHLKQGNSLIGTTVGEVREALEAEEGQFNLFTGPFTGLLQATEMIREIGEHADVTFDQVEESATLYESFQQKMEPYKRVLDLWVSRHFGNDGAESLLRSRGKELLDSLRPGGAELPGEQQMTLEEAVLLQQEKSFFHWELEFPEVFIDLAETRWKENPGFDAVVGNPPYDVLAEKERDEQLANSLDYFRSTPSLQHASGSKLDLYRLFLARSLNLLLRTRGAVGFIVPMSLLGDHHTRRLRRHILTEHSLSTLDAFPQKDNAARRVFPDAKLPTCIPIIQVGFHDPVFTVRTHPGREFGDVNASFDATARDIEDLDPDNLHIPVGTSATGFQLAVRLSSSPRFHPVGESIETFQGEINETTMSQYLSQNADAGPQVLRGGNVQRYQFIKQPRQGTTKYLDVERFTRNVGGERVKHTQIFRIAYQRNSALNNWRRLIFCPLPTPSYCFDSISYYVVGDNRYRGYYLLSLFNSTLLNWRFSLTSTNNHVNAREIERLPVPDIPTEEVLRESAEGFRPISCALDSQQSPAELLAELSQANDTADSVHSLAALLSLLAHELVNLTEGHASLSEARDLFKYLDRGIGLNALSDILARELKHSTIPNSGHDLSSVHHDIDGLRLTPQDDAESWLLEVQLKKRDPESDWEEWIKVGGGHMIEREWVPAFLLPMEYAKGRYFQHALRVLPEFQHFTSFPSGKTRSTMRKLRLTKVPTYKPSVDLEPLVDLTRRLRETEHNMKTIDALIDDLVFELYGISSTEARTIQGRH